jgi:hypothetical protein
VTFAWRSRDGHRSLARVQSPPRSRRSPRAASTSLSVVALIFGAATACSSSDATPAPDADAGAGADASQEAATLPPVAGAIALTDTVMIVPRRPRATTADLRAPNVPAALQSMVADGFGRFDLGPGESPTERTLDGAAPPAPGPNRKRVARFVHISDFQLGDDESPVRLATFDSPPPLDGAFRPQEGYGCRILNAAVRTMNRIHEDAPLDLVLLGGDNTDDAQSNELDWLFAVLDGGSPVACDSGDRDDLVSGPGNDPKDAFVPEGLAMPWYWVTGNHDVLAVGINVVDASKTAQSIGDTAPNGTRDYTQPGGPTSRSAIPDARRKLMMRPELMARVGADQGRAGPKGHGLGDYAARSSRAFYTIDLPGSPVRFMVLDTCAETGGASGLVRRAQLDEFVKPELDRGKTDGKWMILASHHATDQIHDGGDTGGTVQPDAVPATEWQALIAASPNVILDLVGHAHTQRVQPLAAPEGHAIWEMQAAALADFDNQFRVIEIWDEDDGQLTIRATGVDYTTENDAVAAEGRTLGIVDWTSGWGGGSPGQRQDRNVVLWAKKP